jgi:hypothetical protein
MRKCYLDGRYVAEQVFTTTFLGFDKAKSTRIPAASLALQTAFFVTTSASAGSRAAAALCPATAARAAARSALSAATFGSGATAAPLLFCATATRAATAASLPCSSLPRIVPLVPRIRIAVVRAALRLCGHVGSGHSTLLLRANP